MFAIPLNKAISGATILLTLVSADPFFVVQHGNAVVTTRRDPIISPGGIANHVHSVVGSSSFRATYEYENSVNGKCTSANINVDKSNYWVPQLYRKLDNGMFELVKMNRVNTQDENEEIYEFPKGIKMLSGDPDRRTLDLDDPSQAAIEYVCLGNDVTPSNAFPERSCPEDLRAQITFPNCWDGKNVWLDGSKHVSYPSSGRFDSGGPCPSTHPYRIPTLFYEFHFNDRYDYKPGARVWAQGDDLGYGFHGDFTNGWPEGLFTQIVNADQACEVLFELGNCPPLKQYFTGIGGGTCQPDDPTVFVNEDIGENDPIGKLPGDNPVWSDEITQDLGSSNNSVSLTDKSAINKSNTVNNPAVIPGPSSTAAIQASSNSNIDFAQTSSSAYISQHSFIPESSTPSATTSKYGGGRWGNWGGRED
ncbi:uncharacterized protein L201_006409 [Kwoniella dendrophila CBS 6074]|uniref:DUF1996 domain-containing protein n=1 Tax=Kwoniella dendrophila CBS 6074 TaxID=1295534 RepID=A0AAX4K2R0_9TREE